MKKLKMLALATLIAAPLAASAADNSGIYVGATGGYGMQSSISEKGDSTKQQLDDNGTGLGQVKLGYDFNEYFGVEVRGGAANENSEMLHHYSAYGKVQYPVTSSVSVYGLAGATDARMSTLLDLDKNLTSASYAVGARMELTDNLGMSIEYNQVSSHKDYELGAAMVGIDYKF